MTEGPIRIGSFLNYQIVIFVIVFFWAILGFEAAQFQLLQLYEAPIIWLAWSVFVLVSLIPAITAITWRLKTQVIYVDPIWDLREREVTLVEYEEMIQEYRREYRNFISVIDYGLIALACIIAITAVTIPFLLLRTTLILIAATPVVFGFLVLLFGLVCTSIIFKIIPNEASFHFSTVPAKSLRFVIRMMQKSPGFSWTGLRVTLGEASGFYSIRDVTPISRIEGIESAAVIQCDLDEAGEVMRTVAKLTLDASALPKVVDESQASLSVKLLAELVLKTLQVYIEVKGEAELLDEVVEEVTLFLNRLNET